MFITLRNIVTQQQDFNIIVTSVVSGNNSYVINGDRIKNRFLSDLKSKRYGVIRSIYQRVNLDNFNEYHCFDVHGDHFIIVDLDNISHSDHRLVQWIETIDCKIRYGGDRSFKEIRVYSNKNQGDYSLLNLDDEQKQFHRLMRTEAEKYFLR